jgi:hypothetical protein
MYSSPFFLMNPCAFLMASVLSFLLAFFPTQTQIPQFPLSTMKESSEERSVCVSGPDFISDTWNGVTTLVNYIVLPSSAIPKRMNLDLVRLDKDIPSRGRSTRYSVMWHPWPWASRPVPSTCIAWCPSWCVRRPARPARLPLPAWWLASCRWEGTS